jgi:Leucine-rich repeat (LRR) protein
VLGLHYCQLMALEGLKCPNLLRVDLSNNRFATAAAVEEALEHTPSIQQLELTGNPLCNGWQHLRLPPAKDPFWRVIFRLRDLEFLNSGLIPNRLRGGAAWDEHNDRHTRPTVPTANWHHALNQNAVMLAMRGEWMPLAVTALRVIEQGLLTFHAYPFARTITDIDLSYNAIKTIADCGFSFCDKLRSLNLSHNRLEVRKDLSSFYAMPALQRLWLQGNASLGRYKNAVLYYTRELPGTNRRPGLLELDGQPVTLEDRITAIAEEGSPSMQDHERWQLLKIAAFGAHQLRHDPSYVASIRNARFANCNLGTVNLASFTGLAVVDLSHNRLSGQGAEGLSELTALRSLNLSGNRALEADRVVRALNAKPITTLEHIWLAIDPAKADAEWRRHVLKGLGHNNPKLAVIDGVHLCGVVSWCRVLFCRLAARPDFVFAAACVLLSSLVCGSVPSIWLIACVYSARRQPA